MNFYLFIFGCAGSSLLCRLFSGFSKQWLLCSCDARVLHCGGFSCCRAWALGHTGFSSCGTRAQELQFEGSSALAKYLWFMDLVAPWHVGSSWTRDQTQVSCIGRQILSTEPPGKPHRVCIPLYRRVIHCDYCDIEWFALEMNRVHSVLFEIASKYCILDCFVDCEGGCCCC